MVCRTWLVGCSGLVIAVGLPNVGVTRSTRSPSAETGRHSSVVSPDSSTTLMHCADRAASLLPHATATSAQPSTAYGRRQSIVALVAVAVGFGVGAGRVGLRADNLEVVVEL